MFPPQVPLTLPFQSQFSQCFRGCLCLQPTHCFFIHREKLAVLENQGSRDWMDHMDQR